MRWPVETETGDRVLRVAASEAASLADLMALAAEVQELRRQLAELRPASLLTA